jgi:hypothetical protein
MHTAKQTATLKACQEQASKIFQPYTVNFGDTEWFSIYKIGQRLANACKWPIPFSKKKKKKGHVHE